MNIPSAIKPFKRSAWKPMTIDSDGAVTASKFSGTPYLEPGEEHPRCPNCRKPLQFFIQLDLEKLPEPIGEAYGTGLLQLFYCTGAEPLCEVECQAFFPFSKSVLVRIIQPQDNKTQTLRPAPADSFPPKLITGWEEIDDYPNSEEGRALGIVLADDQWDSLIDQDYPRTGDKLAGYPAWVQGVEYPDCPICGETMRLVFQIDSEDNLPFMFGDVGCGHITQCRAHKDHLAFGWAYC